MLTAKGVSVLLLCAAAVSFEASAQEAPAPGAVLAVSCFTCHGAAGQSPGAIPSLDGLDGPTIAARMREFSSGAVEATIMDRIAKGFTDQQIDTIVQYLVSQR